MPMIDSSRTSIICGDLNICALQERGNVISQRLEEAGFVQFVQEATYIQGGLIDHVYIKKLYDNNITIQFYFISK